MSSGMKASNRKNKFEYWITDDGLLLLESWTRDGYTDDMIAAKIGINRGTIYDWKKKYPTFANALKKGKEIVDIQVENALLKRALGYEYEEVKTIVEKDEQGKDKKRLEKITKTVLPDTVAQIFWLKNRKPVQWRDKQELNIEGGLENKNTINLNEFTKEELMDIANSDKE